MNRPTIDKIFDPPPPPNPDHPIYLGEDDYIMVAEIKSAGSAINVTGVRPLFETRPIRMGTVYDVFSDGRRFLVNTRIEPEVSSPITLVANWMKDMREK